MLTSPTSRITPLIIGATGYAGSGKTTLLCRLIPHFGRVAVLKHSHHQAHARRGGDTQRLREAGAEEVILVPDDGANLVGQASLGLLSDRFEGFDAILLEGWKSGGDWPRLILNRIGVQLLRAAPGAIAEVTDLQPATSLPSFHPDAIDALILFLDRIGR